MTQTDAVLILFGYVLIFLAGALIIGIIEMVRQKRKKNERDIKNG